MPKRKISIEEAFKVLEDAGIQLQVKQVDTVQVLPTLAEPVKIAGSLPVTAKPILGGKLVRITLFATHSIGSGGTLVKVEGETAVENAGVQSYGPGICYVPSDIASYLLSADAAAREADDRMLSREQRSYLIVQKIGNNSQRSNVAVQVPNEVLDSGLGALPMNMMHTVK